MTCNLGVKGVAEFMGQDPHVQRWVVLEFARERDRVASNFLGAGLAPLVGVLPDETDAESRGDGLKMIDGLVEDSSAALNIGPRPLSGKARRRWLRGEMVLGGPNNLEPGGERNLSRCVCHLAPRNTRREHTRPERRPRGFRRGLARM